MNVAATLAETAASMPDAHAIIDFSGFRTRRVPYAAFAAAVGRASTGLRAAGLHSGDAVLVLQPMSVELYIALAAILHSGLAAMVVDPSAGRDVVERALSLWAPAGIICSKRAQLLRLLWPALRRIATVFDAAAFGPSGADAFCATVPPERADDGAPALVTFTSGSTGAPKAAVRSHGVLAAQLAALRDCLRLERGGIAAATLPIVPLANLACGVTTLIPGVDLRRPGFANPAVLSKQIIECSADSIVASPALLERLAGFCARSGVRLPSLGRISVGGAPVFAETLDGLRAMAPQAEIIAVYGSTEAEPIASLDVRDVTDEDRTAMRSGSGLLAGRAVKAAKVKVIRAQHGRPVSVASAEAFAMLEAHGDEIGEIVVAGAHVLSGYLRGIGDDETKIHVGERVWHRTGDLGRIDTHGRLWLFGRCAAALHDSRGDLYPFAVECAVRGFPGVRRSALADVDGRRVLAVEGTAIDLPALNAAVTWARLDDVRVIRQIPVDRRHNAKVDHTALHRALAR